MADYPNGEPVDNGGGGLTTPLPFNPSSNIIFDYLTDGVITDQGPGGRDLAVSVGTPRYGEGLFPDHQALYFYGELELVLASAGDNAAIRTALVGSWTLLVACSLQLPFAFSNDRSNLFWFSGLQTSDAENLLCEFEVNGGDNGKIISTYQDTTQAYKNIETYGLYNRPMIYAVTFDVATNTSKMINRNGVLLSRVHTNPPFGGGNATLLIGAHGNVANRRWFGSMQQLTLLDTNLSDANAQAQCQRADVWTPSTS